VWEESIYSIMFVLLTVKEAVLGILSMCTSDPRVFPEEEMNFVQTVTNFGAQALANARCCEWARRMDIEIAPDILNWNSSWAETLVAKLFLTI
jgi:GAF domain-containing protein